MNINKLLKQMREADNRTEKLLNSSKVKNKTDKQRYISQLMNKGRVLK